jgi:hypothetical protein
MKVRVVRQGSPIALTLMLALGPSVAPAAESGKTPDPALVELGWRMYHEGINPDGEPMEATVQGDIPVDGSMFTCASCHLRSGLGSLEGSVITLPTNWGWLRRPLVGNEMSELARERLPNELRQEEFRPAYDDRTLARAIRVGKDPNRREFDLVMPRYALDNEEMDTLIAYLKTLSAEFSPGVTDTTLHFATVVTDGVSEEDRLAMVAVLQAHVDDRNSQVRHEDERRRRGPYYKQEKWDPYRRWQLDVWHLEGQPGSWPDQLAEYYEKQPVFALVGGISDGEWRPIHEFCERNEIPSLFPATDYPVISETNWYTVYFSKGHYQEGEAVARYLRRAGNELRRAPVIQVYRDTPASRAMATGFSNTRDVVRMSAPMERMLSADEQLTADLLAEITAATPGASLVLWLGPSDIAALAEFAKETGPSQVFMSTTLLGDATDDLPESLRDTTLLTHPRAFPEDKRRTRLAVERWLKIRQIPLTNYDLQAKMYFVGWNLAGQVKMMRDEFYRDYFLDITDMMRDQDYAVGVYERLSFGPGQRYASKGCYLTALTGGPDPSLEKRSGWVVH